MLSAWHAKKKDEIGWDLMRLDEITGWDISSGFDEISDGIRWDRMGLDEIRTEPAAVAGGAAAGFAAALIDAF